MLRLCAFARTLVPAIALSQWVPLRVLAQLPAQLSIDWDGPATCPKSERFEAELVERLDPELELRARQQIRVRVEALEGERYQLTLTTQGATGAARRSVDLDDCAEVQRAAAVLIATALSPDEAERESEEASPRGEQPWSLRLAGLFDVSALPRPSGGPSLGLGHDHGALRFWIDARYLVGRESAQPAPARVQVDLFTVALGGAYLWRFGAVGLGPLLELELGALRGEAALDGEGSAAAPWIAGLGGGLLEADLGPIALVLALSLGVPVLRPEFEAQNEDDVYGTRPITGRAQLGVKVPLGRADAEPKNPDPSGQ